MPPRTGPEGKKHWQIQPVKWTESSRISWLKQVDIKEERFLESLKNRPSPHNKKDVFFFRFHSLLEPSLLAAVWPKQKSSVF